MAKGGRFMTKTDNYQLNQWEPGDPIRRQDFNRDNARVDAAILAAREYRPYVIGTYSGTNSTATTRVVELGFQPTAVLIVYPQDTDGSYGTMITREYSLSYNGSVMARITETGFEVGSASTGSSLVKPYTNLGSPYIYIAFR
jgi:hypothetical protein